MMATYGAVSDEKGDMATFLFQWICDCLLSIVVIIKEHTLFD